MESRIAVLASGSGTNLQALLDDPAVGPCVVVVISDRGAAGALGRARARGVEALALDSADVQSREDHDRALLGLLEERGIDLVALAGYMRILGPLVVTPFRERILNVHPSLLPAFPGAHAPRDALSWGVKVTGCTVHLVDEQVDHGPILLQEAVPVLPGDDEPALHGRIQAVEHRLYPIAVRAMAEGRIRLQGRRVDVLDGTSGAGVRA